MKPFVPWSRLNLVVAVLLAIGCQVNAPAQVYVAYANSGIVSEYDEDSGALINEMFVLGLKEPHNLCVQNGVLYVVQRQSGYIGTYDLHTGAALRPELVPGLNMPQAMTVAGDAIYVSDFDWQTHQPRIGKYNAFTGAMINPSLVKLTGAVINGLTMTAVAPNALAVSGNRLIVASEGGVQGLKIFDTTTGAPIDERFVPFLASATGLEVSGKWLYLAIGGNAPTGVVFKLDAETGQSPFAIPGMPFPRPMVFKLDYPYRLAVSGDSLFVGGGSTTTIGKYNATTGAVINANFIHSSGDRLGGLAVVPREPTEEENATDAQFEWKKTLFDFGFMLLGPDNYIFFAGCAVLVVIALGFIALAFRPRSPTPGETATEPTAEAAAAPPVEAMPAETMHEAAPAADIAAAGEEPPPSVDDAPPAPAQPQSSLRLGYVVMGLLLLTLVAAAYMGYSLLAPTGTGLSPYGDRERDRIGAWEFDSSETGAVNERPIIESLNVYPHEIDYSEGSGSYTKAGKWHDDGFWIENDDGSGETEVAHLVDPLDMEVHVRAFISNRSDAPVLYKVQGSEAEVQAVAAKYPSPVTYPPPKGAITYEMTEYDLNMLPWKPDYLSSVGEHAYSRGTLYHFHSDDPKIPPLEVTLKLRRVVEIHGGYP